MKDTHFNDDEALFHLEERKKSKTCIKKEMIEIQKLGERLVDLPKSYVKKIGLPPELLEAVLYAKEVRTHGARRRHNQHIGALMRETDPAFIKTVLDNYTQGLQEPLEEAPKVNKSKEMVEDLLNGGDGCIDALAARFPSIDRKRLHRLVRHVRDESSTSVTKAKKALIIYLGKFIV